MYARMCTECESNEQDAELDLGAEAQLVQATTFGEILVEGEEERSARKVGNHALRTGLCA